MSLTRKQSETAELLHAAGQSPSDIVAVLNAAASASGRASSLSVTDVEEVLAWTPPAFEVRARELWETPDGDGWNRTYSEIADALNVDPNLRGERKSLTKDGTFNFAHVRYARENAAKKLAAPWADQRGSDRAAGASSSRVSWVNEQRSEDEEAVTAAANLAISVLNVPEHGFTSTHANATSCVTLALARAASEHGIGSIAQIREEAVRLTSRKTGPNGYGPSTGEGWTGRRRNPFIGTVRKRRN